MILSGFYIIINQLKKAIKTNKTGIFLKPKKKNQHLHLETLFNTKILNYKFKIN